MSDERPEEVSLRELRELGGPSLGRLRRAVREALESGAPAASLGELFAGLDDSWRRPVEILGLLHVAANTPGLSPPGPQRESYVTVRPDGTRREFLVPVVPLPPRTEDQKS